MSRKNIPLAGDSATLPIVLDATTPISNGESARAETLPIGAVLSRYVIIGHLGEGGMGVVYAAYDPHLDRKVALKLLRDAGGGASYEEARARMLREAQALARLSHPNVVAVHDVGVFEGRIFVAMEFVDGMTLRTWLHERERTVAEVVAMFTQAGRGLAAAHAQGIVHRDFKPDNVLVGKDGRARVLDFGLAHGEGGEHPPSAGASNAVFDEAKQGSSDGAAIQRTTNAFDVKLTRADAVMGTPAYMSPEQYQGQPTDARTDEFSFCVALYEALHGNLPFDGENLDELARNIILGKVVEEPKRKRVPDKLRRAVLRGLDAKRENRFATMDELLAAIQLSTRRNPWKWMLAAALVLLPAVAMGMVATREDPGAACRTSREKLAGIWDADRKQAIQNAFLATEKPFAKDAFSGVDRAIESHVQAWVDMRTDACLATRVRGEQSPELLDLRMECLSRKLVELRTFTDVLSTATADVVEKSVQSAQSLFELDTCENAELLRAPLRPPGDPAVRAKIEDVRKELARVQALQLAGRYKEQLPIAEQAVAMATELHYRPLEAEALFGLAKARRRTGARAEAETTLMKAIISAEAGRHDEVAGDAWRLLAGWQADGGALERARTSAEYAAAKVERYGRDEKKAARLEATWGDIEYAAGKYEKATQHYKMALESTERAFGPGHLEVASLLYGLASTARFQGQLNDALAYARRALELREKALGPEHPFVASTLTLLGLVLTGQGDLDEARRTHERALAIAEKAYDPDNPFVANVLGGLADAMAVAEPDKAIALYTRALAIDEKRFGVGHFKTASALDNIGNTLVLANRPEEALPYFDRVLGILEKAKGPLYPELATVLNDKAHALSLLRRSDEALAQYERAVEIAKKAHGEAHPYIADALVGIGRVHIERRQAFKAIPLLERAVEMRVALEEDPRRIAAARFALARGLWDVRAHEPRALELANDARAIYEKAGVHAKKELAEVAAWLQSHGAR